MAKPKKAGVERKKKIADLPARDVETAKARVVTGGKASFNDIQVTKYYDKSTPVIASS
jgi:hypothetical protein